MKNVKKHPVKQLEKFSTIFTQLGLVLVLFVVYIVIEHETEQKQFAINVTDNPQTIIIEPDQDVIITREPKKQPKIETPKKDVFLADEPVEKGDNDIVESIVDFPKEDSVELNPDDILEVDEPKDEEPETVPFIFIQNTPVFKGCEGLSEKENKACFDKKMKRFVQRNFDASLANQLGLSSGKYKIFTQFIIDDKGKIIDVKIKAPHTKLKSETEKLIKKLPKFTPGKQGDKTVKVKYTLPISFFVNN